MKHGRKRQCSSLISFVLGINRLPVLSQVSENQKWRHQMEIFSALLALCARNSSVTDDFPSQRPVTRNILMFSLICAWMNAWVNNRKDGDSRRHRAHYDVIVMILEFFSPSTTVTRGHPTSSSKSLDMQPSYIVSYSCTHLELVYFVSTLLSIVVDCLGKLQYFFGQLSTVRQTNFIRCMVIS